jgi:hypothetical protein
MALLKNSGAPGLAAGTLITTANSGGAAGDAFTVVSGSTLTFESTGMRVVAAASANVYVGWTGVTGATNAMAARGYLGPLSAIPSPNAQVFFNVRSGGGGTSFFNLLVTASGFVQVLSDASGTAIGTTTTALSTGVEYRWEVAATNGTTTTGTVTLRIYVGDSTTVHSQLDLTGVNIGTTAFGHARFARPAAIGSAWTYDFRKIAFQTGSSTLIGPDVVANVAPIANAGSDQIVEPWNTVTLTGIDSDSDGTVVTRGWTQTGGSAVTINGSGATVTFSAPATIAGTTLTFQYSATDNGGLTSTDTMTVTVLPVTERAVINGVEVPMRII